MTTKIIDFLKSKNWINYQKLGFLSIDKYIYEKPNSKTIEINPLVILQYKDAIDQDDLEKIEQLNNFFEQSLKTNIPELEKYIIKLKYNKY